MTPDDLKDLYPECYDPNPHEFVAKVRGRMREINDQGEYEVVFEDSVCRDFRPFAIRFSKDEIEVLDEPTPTTNSVYVAHALLPTGEEVEIRRTDEGLLVGFDAAYLQEIGDHEHPNNPYDKGKIIVPIESGKAELVELRKSK